MRKISKTYLLIPALALMTAGDAAGAWSLWNDPHGDAVRPPSERIIKVDHDEAVRQQAEMERLRAAAARERADAERLEAEKLAAEEAARQKALLEEARKEAEEKARIEAEKRASEEAAERQRRLEAARREAEEAERIAVARRAAEEAQQMQKLREAAAREQAEAERRETEKRAAEESARQREASREVFSQAAAPITAQIPTVENAYRIGPGDVLDISVWKDEALTRSVAVSPDGRFTFPLIGEVKAEGKTVSELKKELEEKISAYVPDPVLSVDLRQVNSMQIYVIGRVNNPGRFQLNDNITVLQALAVAGGLNPFAKRSEIKVMRQEGGETRTYAFHYDRVLKGKGLEENIPLQRGDVLVVP